MNNIQTTHEIWKMLTEKEISVMKASAEGKTASEIGKELFCSTRTIESHRQRVFEKLDCHCLAQAVAVMIRSGVI